MSMFCYQCQEAMNNEGCHLEAGMCDKPEDVAILQDVLIYVLKGISIWATKARQLGVNDPDADIFVAEGLFATITNVNFNPADFMGFIKRAFQHRDQYKSLFISAYLEKTGQRFEEKLPEAATFQCPSNLEAYLDKGVDIGILATEDEDIRSLRELLIYGMKGIAAYADHAYVLKYSKDEIFAFLEEGLAATTNDQLAADDLVALVMKCGEVAVQVMALLDEANTSTFGTPEVTQVSTGLKAAPGILVSGHDLLDLEEILKQTEGTGILVYTHGEMLPANAYPGLKKYAHLAGNFGTGWYNQDKDFKEFTGAIVMTTNCLTWPQDAYQDRLFTTGLVGWPGIKHVASRVDDQPKDFSEVIAKAKECGDLTEHAGETRVIGFHHNTIMSVADTVISAVKDGAIKRFVVMAGCDGRHKEREYYTRMAQQLPTDTVILTAGCAKYRYNHLDLGNIGGIPRILDAGQCNDSYSLAVTALKLKDAFGLADINDLPISYDIAWYEQKAVCVLLALLYLGVKGIRLGPTLPAFLSANVIQVLVDKFDLKPIGTVADDLAAMMAGN